MSNILTNSDLKISENDTANNCTDRNILNILNWDCLHYVFSYLPINDLIRSDRVSKQWRFAVNEHLKRYSTFKTSSWPGITDKMLLHLLLRLGTVLMRLHVDDQCDTRHKCSALNSAVNNDDFCPNLEELVINDSNFMHSLFLFVGCNKLKSLTLSSNSIATILPSVRCKTLIPIFSHGRLVLVESGHNCYAKTFELKMIAYFSNLTTFKIDHCASSVLLDIPNILNHLTHLQELSISGYLSSHINIDYFMLRILLRRAFSKLIKIKHLNLKQNIVVEKSLMKQIAQSCKMLETLDVSFNSTLDDESVIAICVSCENLQMLNVSYLESLSDQSIKAASQLKHLTRLIARGLPRVSNASIIACLHACPMLTELDACGCYNLTSKVVHVAIDTLQLRYQPLKLRLANTAVTITDKLLRHSMLIIDTEDLGGDEYPLVDDFFYTSQYPERLVRNDYQIMDLSVPPEDEI